MIAANKIINPASVSNHTFTSFTFTNPMAVIELRALSLESMSFVAAGQTMEN